MLTGVGAVINTARVQAGSSVAVLGLGVRVKVRADGAAAELDLGDQGRFWPSDDALARWKQIMPRHAPQVVYD